ncbi:MULTISPECIES: hypothetical protein [Pseudomonas]|jgi:hypothetical protein|uniref:hypothetical protein n=1 Tax=Pseudomonas TaxID=286 RepID=UPI0018E893DE|nr:MULTISPECIES: hypothetical protein [Pseudomonas]MBJ2213981.1 hypothetical protein [Pseudomonas carnis]MBP5947868.1 hypothetical protein [Pseudomonas sp. P9(2020)]
MQHYKAIKSDSTILIEDPVSAPMNPREALQALVDAYDDLINESAPGNEAYDEEFASIDRVGIVSHMILKGWEFVELSVA